MHGGDLPGALLLRRLVGYGRRMRLSLTTCLRGTSSPRRGRPRQNQGCRKGCHLYRCGRPNRKRQITGTCRGSDATTRGMIGSSTSTAAPRTELLDNRRCRGPSISPLMHLDTNSVRGTGQSVITTRTDPTLRRSRTQPATQSCRHRLSGDAAATRPRCTVLPRVSR